MRLAAGLCAVERQAAETDRLPHGAQAASGAVTSGWTRPVYNDWCVATRGDSNFMNGRVKYMPAKGLAVLCLAVTVTSVAWAQAAATALQSTLGTVTKIDATARTLSVKTDAGQEYAVTLQAKATVQRIPPGQTDVSKAEAIALGDVEAGDRVLARGTVDNLNVSATRIVVMSKGDIAKMQDAERADWDKRGVTGLVTAVATDSVTISVKNLTGAKQVTIALAPKAIVRRYAPDSVKFSEAKTSKLAEIKIGDQVRARGDKTDDGSKVSAEEIVSGSFKTIAGVVLSIDPQENVMQVRDLETKKPLTVKIIPDSTMKKFQPQAAQLIAVRLHPELAQAGGGGRGGRGQGGGGRGGDGQGGGRGGGAADLQQLLDRSPAITVADLKVGDAIVVSSTVGASADKVTAISLVAGVEPIITKPGTQEMSLGDWNLAGGGGGIAQ
jgi:hypothetical protein